MAQPTDRNEFSIRIANSKRAGTPDSDPLATQAITWVEIETREGYYRDRLDEWQLDRRNNPDRRANQSATAKQVAMRTNPRRHTDREIIQYLAP